MNGAISPLTLLDGTWVGANGWNLVAVPAQISANTADNIGERIFKLIVQPYTETITFNPIGETVLNRGKKTNEFIEGVTYELRVTDTLTNMPLHVENGMWLSSAKKNQTTGEIEVPSLNLTRMSMIPHGNSVMAFGGSKTASGQPEIFPVDSRPIVLSTGEVDTNAEYLKQYKSSLNDLLKLPAEDNRFDFDVLNPNKSLVDALDSMATKNQKILETTTISISTKNERSEQPGNVQNIPFIENMADVPAFRSDYWIERVEGLDSLGNKTEFYQLQYSQQTDIDFAGLMWPHFNVNTLIKQ